VIPAPTGGRSNGSDRAAGAPNSVSVRVIREEEWAAVRELRLEALRTDPLAFGSTIEREEAFPPELWQDRARQAQGPRSVTVVAEAPTGVLVGMGGIYSDETAFHVVAMWVRPDHRSQGLGAALLDALLDWHDRRSPPALPLTLEVNPRQESALRLYRSRGFEPTGVERSLGHHAPEMTLEMVRRPSRP